nr:hypothetical protein [Tanacetum cinerariifolium]
MTSEGEITTPLGFSAVSITTTIFSTTTPENMTMAYRASTSANPNPVISLAFVEANYKALESLLRDQRRQMRNTDLRTELEYFSKDYDKEREMELRPDSTRAASLPLRVTSLRIRRRRERTVGFKGAQSKGESMVKRNTGWGEAFSRSIRENKGHSVNLPSLLAAHLGRGENRQPLQSSLTFAYEGQTLPNNLGWNLPSKKDYPLPDGLKMPSHINSYEGKGDPEKFLHLFEGEQQIFGFVHGLRTRNLVEHLSTDLPSTYEALIEKTYTWVEAREVTTNGASSDHRYSFESLSKSPKEILATKKAVRSFEPPPKMFESKRLRDMSKYYHFHEDYGHDSNDCRHLRTQIQEVVNSGQLSHLVKGIKKERTRLSNTPRRESKKDKGTTPAKAPYLWSESSHNMLLGRTPMQRMGIVVLTIHGAIKFHNIKGIGSVLLAGETGEGTKRSRKIFAINKERILSCVNAEEKIS